MAAGLDSRAAVALLCALCASSLGWSQGMGGKRAPRRVQPVESRLPPIRVDFRDVAVEAGLTAAHVSGGRDRKKYILETTGGGVALFDFDNDGLVDVFLPNGAVLAGEGAAETPRSHLYRNLGRLRFEEVAVKARVARTGWGQGACVGDYDDDGDRDMFVTEYGHSVLYRNEGDGTFRDATASAGLLRDAVRWETGCSFVDYDLDGRLDLVVTAYLEFDADRSAVGGGPARGLPGRGREPDRRVAAGHRLSGALAGHVRPPALTSFRAAPATAGGTRRACCSSSPVRASSTRTPSRRRRPRPPRRR